MKRHLGPLGALALILGFGAVTPAVAADLGESNGPESSEAADLGFDWELDVPEAMMYVVDPSGGGPPCLLGVSGKLTLSRSSGSVFVREVATAVGRTNCPGGITATAQIVDLSPGQPTYSKTSNVSSSLYVSGYATARATAIQDIPYFSSPPSVVAISSRPVSYITMKLSARGRHGTACNEYSYTVVNGQQVIPTGAISC